MTLTTISNGAAAADTKKGKVTCLTCKLKGCVGHCRFQYVPTTAPKAA